MQAGPSAALQARARHRHELRTLTYVTLDQANGGIVRNLTHDGIAVQAVAAVRPKQQLRVRFELRYPRLRVETRGEVVWSTFSGQCGIRFLDLSPRLVRQIDEWIFGDLLQGGGLAWDRSESVLIGSGSNAALRAPATTPTQGRLGAALRTVQAAGDDGLLISPAPANIIELPPLHQLPEAAIRPEDDRAPRLELDWLSQPLSGRSLAWTVNTLVVTAALLLSMLVFLSITREPPPWPMTMTMGAALAVCGMYWGFFKFLGGASFGERLARLAEADLQVEEETVDTRFR